MFSDHLFLRTPLDGCFCLNLLLVGLIILLFCCFVFLRVLFHISAIMKLRIASALYIFCFIFILASHGIIMLKIDFFVPEETKFEVDTTSIILSYLYNFRNVNNELFKLLMSSTINHASEKTRDKINKIFF